MDFLRQLRWQDLVDIILMSIIFYRLLLMIKGTKAAHMIMGLGLLLLDLYSPGILSFTRWTG